MVEVEQSMEGTEGAPVTKVRRGNFLRDTASLVVGSVAAQIITVALTPFITRLFSPDAFGVFALVMALVGPFVAVTGFRYHEAIMLPVSEAEAGVLFRLALFLVVGSGLVLFAVVYLFGSQIAALMHLKKNISLLYAVPFLVVLFGARRALDARMQRARAFGRIAMASVSVAAIDRAVSIGAGFAGYLSAWSLAIGRIAGVCTGALWLSAQKRTGQTAVSEDAEVTTLKAVAHKYAGFAKYSWAGLVQQLNKELPVIVLGVAFGASTAGLFALARRVVIQPVLLVGDALSKTFFQRATEIHRSGGSVARLSTELTEYLLRWIIPPMVLFSCVAPEAFELVFGNAWRQAGVYSVFVTPMFMTGFVMYPLGRLFDMLQRQREWAGYILLQLLGSIIVLFVGALSGSPELLFAMLSIFFVLLGSLRIRWILSQVGVPKNAVWPTLLDCVLRALLWAAPVVFLKLFFKPSAWVDIFVAVVLVSAYVARLLVSDPRFNIRLRKRSA